LRKIKVRNPLEALYNNMFFYVLWKKRRVCTPERKADAPGDILRKINKFLRGWISFLLWGVKRDFNRSEFL
jgi:hypothetical protein